MRGNGASMKEQISTKDKILLESMKLFSIQGYEAVSVRTIAAAVGVRDSALYKHFKGKQEIFDTIVEQSRQRFYRQYEEVLFNKKETFDFVEMCLSMYRFQTGDEWIVRFRQMLIIEQFKNNNIAHIYNELFIDMPVRNQKEIFEELIQKGIMKEKDPEVMAMELYAPFFMYHTIEGQLEEREERFRKHAEYFMENYFIKN